MSVTNAGDDRGSRDGTNARNGPQQPLPCVLLRNLFEAVFVPADPSMQCHKMFAEVVDHLSRNVRQVQYFASQVILGKIDDPCEPFWGEQAKFGDQPLMNR